MFYSYLLSICLRYTNNTNDAIEILNDSYLKIFTEVKKFVPKHNNVEPDFKAWIKRITINTAIDHYRKYNKHNNNIPIEETHYLTEDEKEYQLEKISYKEIIHCIQQLSPAYRTVFSLFVLDGFSHEQISQELSIAIGTSKSNLSKARQQLQKMLVQKQNFLVYEQ